MKFSMGSRPGSLGHESAPAGQPLLGDRCSGVSATPSPEASLHSLLEKVCSSPKKWPTSCVSVSPRLYDAMLPPGSEPAATTTAWR
jgi:hypothetical protein